MTGTFASRAFLTRAAIFGTDATQVGRGGQITEVMSSTRSAAPLTGISTATGSGIFGTADVGAAEAVGVGLGAAVVATAACVGVGVAAGAVHAATNARAVMSPTTRRIRSPLLSEAGELPLPDDGVKQCGPAFFPDHVDSATERRADLFRIVDRALAVPAERFREHREVRGRIGKIHPDVRPRSVGAALLGDSELMLPAVVERAVVVHDEKHRELEIRGGPERTRIEEQI